MSEKFEERRRRGLGDWLAIAALVISVGGNAIQFITDQESANAREIKELRKEVQELRQGNLELRGQVQSKDFQIMKLVAEREYELDRFKLLASVMDDDPAIAWVKRAEVLPSGEIAFTMFYINPNYEKAYSVRLEKYKGKTDFDIWPPEIAEGYYRADLEVYTNKTRRCAIENVPQHALKPIGKDNLVSPAFVCKWAINLQNGDWAIGGRIIKDSPIMEAYKGAVDK